MIKFSKGSKWRKCDLHIHTPNSNLNNQYESWETFFNELEELNFEMIGVTNYFCFNGEEVKKVREYLDEDKLVLPNLEFRIHQPNKDDEFINIHVLFSEEVSVSSINNTLSRIELINTDCQGETSFYCEMDTLEDIGFENTLVNYNKLVEQLKKDFKEFKDYVVIGCPRGYGNFRPATGDGRGAALATEIDKLCHGFFGNGDNVEFYLNNNRYEGAIAKPVFDCSDAHKEEKIGDKFTWIKSNPTFEGLKQAIYEPKERIKIQQEIPDSKKDYQLIEKVQFNDDNFCDDEICFNKNLTTIIGGRSTGKSLLLRTIAKAIDKNQVDQRLKKLIPEKAKLNNLQYNIPKELKVFWGDGKESIYKNSDLENSDRKIIYIPQNYLNSLVDIEGESEVHNFIERILKQEDEIKKKFKELKIDKRRIRREINDKIQQIFEVKKDISDEIERKKEFGDKQGVEKEIKKIKKEVEKLKKESDLEEIEGENFSKLKDKLDKTKENINCFEKDIDYLKEVDLEEEFFNKEKSNFDDFLNKNKTSQKLKEELINKYSDLQEELKKELQLFIDDKIEELKTKLQEEREEKEKHEKLLDPLLEKIKDKKILDTKMDELENEQKILKNIINKEEKIEDMKVELEDLKDKVIKLNKNFKSKYEEVKEKVLELEGNKFKDLEFDVDVEFKNNLFYEEVIEEVLNYHSFKELYQEFKLDLRRKNNVDYSSELGIILHGILNDILKTKKSFSKEEAVKKIFKDRFYLKYKIKEGNDLLNRMSPGKKSLVLLKLLIELDKSKCPILIDQPEDDLDNRSIYNDLVEFIKEKKKERQIIIVTHNPNLVVSADAEQIIVANQDGEDEISKNKKYRFEYISGAIENSFKKENEDGILYKQGIREHICDILEGGEEAFEKREKKYDISPQ